MMKASKAPETVSSAFSHATPAAHSFAAAAKIWWCFRFPLYFSKIGFSTFSVCNLRGFISLVKQTTKTCMSQNEATVNVHAEVPVQDPGPSVGSCKWCKDSDTLQGLLPTFNRGARGNVPCANCSRCSAARSMQNGSSPKLSKFKTKNDKLYCSWLRIKRAQFK